jgi:Ca-activated chloride channel family protein
MTTRTDTTFTVRQDRRLIRPNSHSQRFLLATIRAPRAIAERARPPVNLAIVLDRSGSMSGDKLRVAKAAVAEAIGRLGPDDRVSVVVYDDVVDVVIASTRAAGESRRTALEQLRAIEARGSTNLGEGWLRGCEQVAAHLVESGVNRCLLLTDGLANVGITDSTELARHAGELRARGVSTSTFGVGNDFDEGLLQSLADAGGGHLYYNADAPQIADAITSEVGETLEVVARDVAIELTARDDIRIEPISPYRVTTQGNRTIVAIGDLVSDQVVEVVLRLSFPYGDAGRDTGAIVSLTDRDGTFGSGGMAETEPVRLSWSYADDAANDRQVRDREVDRVVARLFAARARQEAVGRNRGGDFIHARWAITATAERIRSYADDDPELLGLVAALESDAPRFAAPMSDPVLKHAHYASANSLRSRDAQGRSVRRA